jgi:hypothetical protein
LSRVAAPDIAAADQDVVHSYILRLRFCVVCVANSGNGCGRVKAMADSLAQSVYFEAIPWEGGYFHTGAWQTVQVERYFHTGAWRTVQADGYTGAWQTTQVHGYTVVQQAVQVNGYTVMQQAVQVDGHAVVSQTVQVDRYPYAVALRTVRVERCLASDPDVESLCRLFERLTLEESG